jgi:hypothetical protein
VERSFGQARSRVSRVVFSLTATGIVVPAELFGRRVREECIGILNFWASHVHSCIFENGKSARKNYRLRERTVCSGSSRSLRVPSGAEIRNCVSAPSANTRPRKMLLPPIEAYTGTDVTRSPGTSC